MIHTLLVANRGEIARRIFRTCRAMGIRTVAVYSDADVHAPFVTEADVAVRIGPAEAAQSYLDVGAILDAAKATGADAIHPGYGFLSENPVLAEACAEAGVTFIGPSAEAIRTMGSKLASKRLMEQTGVPVLPSIEVTADLDVMSAADQIGFPVLVKASAGGGGKGMRIVESATTLDDAVEGAGREALAAFGDGTVFLEKYLERPRHIEVQVFGDVHGTVVSLNERECSIQRRHQKVIEEAPSVAVDDDLRAALCQAAIDAAAAVDYVGAGTVEFLLEEGGSFFFLEMNTRLQVEHPVTELTTGFDLVQLQIEVAEGFELSDRIRDIEPVGHAIEARLYAEDPARDYLPSVGTVDRFEFAPSVRVDSGVESGNEVTIHYDPMLAKVIAHGPRREDAVRTLAATLRSARLHGLVTNRELLVRVLEHEDFEAGRTDTGLLERLDAAALSRPLPPADEQDLMLLAASIASQRERRRQATVLATLPSGYRNNPSQLNIDTYDLADRTVSLGYRLTGDRVAWSVDGEDRDEVALLDGLEGTVRLRATLDRSYEVASYGDRVEIDGAIGALTATRLPRLPEPSAHVEPGSLLAPMPGKVVRVASAQGASVRKGDPLVVVEAMKMEHTIAAPHDGTVSALPVDEGDQVAAGEILAIVDTD